VLGQEQAESFLSGKLGNSCKVLHPETIQHLGALQFAFAETEGTFDCLVHNGWFGGHAILTALLNLCLSALCSGKPQNLATNCREVSKATAGGGGGMLLLPPDQETGIARIE